VKAAVLIGFGALDRLEVREVPEPIVGPGEVKVRVVATNINPLDWKLREGVRRLTANPKLPAILGSDAAGEVVEVGPGVTRLRVGSRVAGLVSRGYAERVVAREEAWAEVPESMSLADAAAIPLAALTGAQLVDDGVRPAAGDLVLVAGAVGSVGRVAVYTAKARGANVWAGVRSSQRSAAAALGVDGRRDTCHSDREALSRLADSRGPECRTERCRRQGTRADVNACGSAGIVVTIGANI